MRADASSNRIFGWEVLPGLPGEGPVPLHFHLGHPTPWSEGFVIRFWNEDGTDWVANFQYGTTHFNLAIKPPDSDLTVIVSHGACYLLPQCDPERMILADCDVSMAIIGESGSLVVATYDSVHALDRHGKVAWRRDDFAADPLTLLSCVSGVVELKIEDWEGMRRTMRLSESDGRDLP